MSTSTCGGSEFAFRVPEEIYQVDEGSIRMATIRVTQLHKQFRDVVAVDNVNLEIKDGELVGLLGPSGCGKTTTLRCIAGLELPDQGHIFFGDEDVTPVPAEKKDIGMVFQNYALFPHLTIFENLAFGLRTRKVPKAKIKERVEEVLGTVHLSGLEKRYPKQLSGGQQQRVALARSLVTRPKVLLLDEPLANLDAKLREQMRFFTRSIQEELGITTIYVTHDQAEAMVICDRIAVMFEGCIDQVGDPREIYTKPLTHRVADFIGLANLLPARVRSLVNDRLCVLDLDLKESVTATYQGPLSTDQRVILMIRPESMSLHEADSETGGYENFLTATVKTQTFLGSLIDYRLETADGNVLRVQESLEKLLNVGEKALVRFSPKDTWVMLETMDEKPI